MQYPLHIPTLTVAVRGQFTKIGGGGKEEKGEGDVAQKGCKKAKGDRLARDIGFPCTAAVCAYSPGFHGKAL